tara:strand:+ start:350 stop:1036 length:687 start_codon:yes stop_codon:yes gene_type:complete
MVYFLFINAQNNEMGKNRFLFTPSKINTGAKSSNYWLLPPITNERNYRIVVRKLLRDIFGIKRIFGRKPNMKFIKNYTWDRRIKTIVKPLNRINYPELFLLNKFQRNSVRAIVDKVDPNKENSIEGKVLMVNIFYYLEKLNANKVQKVKGYCEYHKTMLASHLNINRKTSIVYDEKLNKFVEKKEPIASAIFRSLMGNTGGARKKTRRNKSSHNKTRDTRRMRRTRKH